MNERTLLFESKLARRIARLIGDAPWDEQRTAFLTQVDSQTCLLQRCTSGIGCGQPGATRNDLVDLRDTSDRGILSGR